MYKLVSYFENNEVYINAVPEAWERAGMLYWPTNKADMLRKIAESQPESEWSIRPCKVKAAGIPNLKKGIELEKKFLDLTDTESEERYLRNISLNRKHPQRRQTLAQLKDYNDMVIAYVESDVNNNTSTENLINYNENDVNNTSTIEDQNFLVANYDANLTNNILIPSPEHQTTFVSEPETSDAVCNNCQVLVAKVDRLETTIQVLMEKLCTIDVKLDQLDKIYNVVTNIPSKSDVQIIEKTKNLVRNFTFPIESHTNMLLLEDKLKNNDFKKEMIYKLSEIGGREGNQAAKAIGLKLSGYVFSKELLVDYSWTGCTKHKQQPNKKYAFLKLTNIIDIFYEVLVLADKTYTRNKNEEFFKNSCLKHANIRLNRKKIQAERESQIEESENLSKAVQSTTDI